MTTRASTCRAKPALGLGARTRTHAHPLACIYLFILCFCTHPRTQALSVYAAGAETQDGNIQAARPDGHWQRRSGRALVVRNQRSGGVRVLYHTHTQKNKTHMHTYAHAHAHTYTLIHHYLCSLLDMGGQAGWCASRWAAYAHRRGGDGAAGVVILVRVCFVRRRGRRGPAARGCPGCRATRQQYGNTLLILASINGQRRAPGRGGGAHRQQGKHRGQE